MQSEANAAMYEQAVQLAESGQYEPALEQMLNYIAHTPGDAKALNDAGTILFCMQRGREAIAYFEKASLLCEGDELAQVYWNLCEACIQENMPERAAGLFIRMRQGGILTAEQANRAAEAFLQKNDLGSAIDAIYTSLALSSDQEILLPMIEIIKSHRPQASLWADTETPLAQSIRCSLEKRMRVKTLIGASGPSAHGEQMPLLSIFVGAGSGLASGLSHPQPGRRIVVLEESDIYHASIDQVNWKRADFVILCAGSQAVADFKERSGVCAVSQAAAVPETENHLIFAKKPGKRIAALGPWNARRNPMFLLQCFQKLHYLDAEFRLHLAGEFEDSGMERYLRCAVEAMELENVVFFDGPVKNLNKWFKDKHAVVSTAIDNSALCGVWTGMACGLHPLVHRFSGIDEMFPSQYSFILAEDFCRKMQTHEFDPVKYRQIASEGYDKSGVFRLVHSAVCRIEKHLTAAAKEPAAKPVAMVADYAATEKVAAPQRSEPAPAGDSYKYNRQGLSIEDFIESSAPAAVTK